MPASVTEQWQGLAENLADYLRFLKEEGQTHVEAPADLLKTPPRTAPIQPMGDRMIEPSRPRPASADAVAASVPSSGADADGLAQIAAQVAQCRLCGLCETRTNTVPGQGARHPELMFVGEGPGADEDEQGQAFVGRSGKLLTKMIEAMGFTRDQVWIGNIVKCRPPNNRVPTPAEMAACIPYLKQQIAWLQPQVIVCLGATAVKGLLDSKVALAEVRGRWMEFEGIALLPTYHPAYLLRNPPAKRIVWDDLKLVLGRLGRPIPST